MQSILKFNNRLNQAQERIFKLENKCLDIIQLIERKLPGSVAGKESACNAGDLGSIPVLGRSAGEGLGYPLLYSWAFLVAQLVKNPSVMQETCFDPELGRSPGEWKGYPLQYSGLENSMDCIVHKVAKSRI